MPGVLDVALAFAPEDAVPVGRLALDGNVAVFEYAPGFAATGLSLTPAFAAVRPGLVRAREPRTFRGLHGVFADSLPDAWGELLLQRRLRSEGTDPSTLTVLDRLAYVGGGGRGALVYAPAEGASAAIGEVDLGRFGREATEVLEGSDGALLRELERLGGSSGGARPKVQVALNEAGRARSDDAALPPGFTSWIVKFRARTDREDSAPLEKAYADVASAGGIALPRTRLIPVEGEPGYFATERFDRAPGGRRRHMLSIAGMLEADWSVPSIDYDGLLDAIRGATRDDSAVLEAFRRMVFNVAAINRDDHAKQHSLLLDRNGRWRLSPAYDLTFSIAGGEHYLAVDGRGSDITRREILAVAKRQSIAATRANAIVDEVVAAVASLPAVAAEFGATRDAIAEVRRAIEKQVALLR